MESVTIKPSLDRLVIEPIVETKTATGIYIPKSEHGEPIGRGKVVARGNGQLHESGTMILPNANVGDTVLYTVRRSMEVKIDGKALAIVNSVDILGTVESV